MHPPKIFGPWQLRKFHRLSNKLSRAAPWLWYGGLVGVVLTTFLFRGDSRWVLLVCVVTIYPALFLWAGLGGVEGLWKIMLRAPWTRGPSTVRAWTAFMLVAGIAMVFLGLGVLPLVAAIWHLMAA